MSYTVISQRSIKNTPIKNLPSNQNYPSWANWIAQDEDGTWWAYEVEPLQFHKGWYENEVGFIQALCKDTPVNDWRLALHKLSTLSSTAKTIT